MSFYSPSDEGFEEALRIRRGELSVDPIFGGFIAEFTAVFGVTPLAVATDTMSSTRGVTPRLGVVLERSSELRAFRDPGGFNYDRAKQARTARLFAKTVPGAGLAMRFGLPRRPRRTSWAEDLFVYFADFERVAKRAAHDEVRGPELESFEASLGLGDQFWCTERFSGPPIIFVHTDEQAARLRDGGAPGRWADLYYPLVQGHDEFGYISREEIVIQVDSKETFDRDYASNWYYYFK